MSRAYTKQEMLATFMAELHQIADYWGTHRGEGRSDRDFANAVIFTVLNVFDGTHGNLPGFDIVPSPCANDKAYHEGEGDNYWPDPPSGCEDAAINDVALHEIWYRKPE